MAKVASDVKAADIKVLFVKPLVYWTRFFIIVTAFSNPQINAIRYGIFFSHMLLYFSSQFTLIMDYLMIWKLGPEWRTWLKKNSGKPLLVTQNQTRGPYWISVSNPLFLENYIDTCILWVPKYHFSVNCIVGTLIFLLINMNSLASSNLDAGDNKVNWVKVLHWFLHGFCL